MKILIKNRENKFKSPSFVASRTEKPNKFKLKIKISQAKKDRAFSPRSTMQYRVSPDQTLNQNMAEHSDNSSPTKKKKHNYKRFFSPTSSGLPKRRNITNVSIKSN